MAYTEGYTIDTRAGRDTVLEAFEKVKAEVTRIYGILNELDGKDLTATELNALKTGTVNGSRVTGAIAGSIDGSNVTGNIAASKVSGALTNATIPNGNVTGLEAFVKNLLSSGDTSGTIICTSDYITFSHGNGLLIEWGRGDLPAGLNDRQIDFVFVKKYRSSPFVIVSGQTAGSEEITVTLKGQPTTTGFSVILGQSSNNINRTVNYIAIGAGE